MNKGTKIIVLIALIAISGYISALTYLEMHEQTHAAIFGAYGIGSTSHFNYFLLSASTTAPAHLCNDACINAQSNAESVGYHIALLIFSLHCLTFFIILFIIVTQE